MSVQPLINQIGGKNPKDPKKIFLKMGSYALKPLQTKHRGIKELSFYEALTTAVNVNIQIEEEKDRLKIIHAWFLINLPECLEENELERLGKYVLTSSFQKMKQEIYLLQGLSSFVVPYYGIIQLNEAPNNQSLSNESSSQSIRNITAADQIIESPSSYLVLKDISYQNTTQTCILDLKMGQQTYEPDASPIKIQQEQIKYSMQSTSQTCRKPIL